MKENIKYITTSKQSFAKQIIKQRDEITALTVNLNNENELGIKQKMLSKKIQNDIKRLDELSKLLETRTREMESTISYLEKDIKTIETSKEDSNKQLLEQRDETSQLSVKLKTEIDSGNKIKRLSKENQAELTILHESVIISKVIEEEKKRMISCLNEDIIGLETMKEGSGKKILLQRHETTEVSIKLQIEIYLGNKLKVLSKERHDGSKRLNQPRLLSETIVEKKERKISCLNESITELETSKEVFNTQYYKRVTRQLRYLKN